MKRWLAGLPAVVAVVGGTGLLAWLTLRPAADRAAWYPAAAGDAFAAEDYRTAVVCYTRVLQQPGPAATSTAAFNLALSLGATGQPDAARALLERLAPLDGGYVDAHRQLIKELLGSDRPTAAAVDEAERRLATVARSSPAGDPVVAFWTAVIAADRGRWDDAATAAGQAGDLRPLLAGRLSKIAAARGEHRSGSSPADAGAGPRPQ